MGLPSLPRAAVWTMALNPQMMPPVAGVTTKLGGQTTEACLHLDERPETPPGVRKWRKSNYTNPGQRIIHPGLIEDFKDAKHTNERFGKIKIVSDHVEDVLVQPGAESEFAQVKLTQKESTYHSIKKEPLGQSFKRGHVLPGAVSARGFAFGKGSTTSGDGSKDLIYNPSARVSADEKQQYIKSHGSFEPGEQRTRGYDWGGRDMNTHRFGVGDGSHVALNGLALGASAALRQGVDTEPITSTRVQNFNSLQDKLGQTRNLGHGNHRPADHLYGKASVRGFGEWDARCCIQGDYQDEDREPDSDLGKTHTPGFRNILTDAQRERTFGTPTVRSDIPKYAKRSIADHQNYGDDANAQELLYPSQLCSMGIDENEFFVKRTKDDLFELFAAIGWDLDHDAYHKLYDDCCDDDGMTNIETFRRILADNLPAP